MPSSAAFGWRGAGPELTPSGVMVPVTRPLDRAGVAVPGSMR